MTENATLNATRREGIGKGAARKLRAAGQVPAVLYGKEQDTLHLAVEAHDAAQLFQSISVASTIVSLKIKGQRGATRTLIREVQVHPFKSELVHIDFMKIQEGVAVEVQVPLELEGTPEGVRADGGVLEQIAHEIPVRCMPDNIPGAITVDVTGMELGDSLHVSDLPVPEGVEILLDPERTVANVAIPRVVVEEVVEEEEEALELEAAAEGEEAAEEEAGEEGEADED